jgi:hypothetical protein
MMASIFFTERPPGHFQIQKLQRRRQAAPRAGPLDRLFADLAQLSGDNQPHCWTAGEHDEPKRLLKSRLYAKSLTDPIPEYYQTFSVHFECFRRWQDNSEAYEIGK